MKELHVQIPGGELQTGGLSESCTLQGFGYPWSLEASTSNFSDESSILDDTFQLSLSLVSL